MLLIALLAACSGGGEDARSEAKVRRSFEIFDQQVRAYYQQQAECFNESGFPTTVERDGSIAISGLDSERDQEVIAMCDRRSGEQPDMPLPSKEGLKQLYQRLLDVKECLQSHDLPATPEPSEEVFVESYLASLSGGTDSAPWHPHVALAGPEVEQCPAPSLGDIYLD